MIENNSEQENDNTPAVKHKVWYLVIPLLVMIFFDYISWERSYGIQFFLLILGILMGVFALVVVEKKRLRWQSLLLLIPILFGAVMTAVRREGVTTFANMILALWGLLLLALTLLNGQWAGYRIREIFKGIMALIRSGIIAPVGLFKKNSVSETEQLPEGRQSGLRRTSPYLRGALIAFPLLLVLGALLAGADPVFKDRLASLFDWIKVDNFEDIAFRTVYVLIFAYILAGLYVFTLTKSSEKKVLKPDEPYFKPFLGHIEAFVVLLLVNILFIAFLLVQFRYFFAGEANISIEGFTYAEYARRGFFELLAVALISLGLYYLLHTFTKRTEKKTKRIFSVLGLLLILQVGVILLSAFQRLSLYESAYGFTTLRTGTHVFMIWLGVLLVAAAVMEIFDQFKRLALVLFLVLFGFTLTLNLLNVDRFIAERNIEHAAAGNQLDAHYLVWNLSDDMIPTLFEYAQAKDTPEEVRQDLDAVLACSYITHTSVWKDRDAFWASWHPSKERANALFNLHKEELLAYPFIKISENTIYYEDGQAFDEPVESYSVMVNGEEIWCGSKLLP